VLVIQLPCNRHTIKRYHQRIGQQTSIIHIQKKLLHVSATFLQPSSGSNDMQRIYIYIGKTLYFVTIVRHFTTRFNITTVYVLPTMYYAWISEQRWSPYTAITGRVFKTQMKCGYCAVRTEPLNTVRSEKSLCTYKRCWKWFPLTILSRKWIKQLHTLQVLHFNRCLTTEYSETTAHFNGNFDTDNQIYVP
jgi:hypothetical protein